MNSIGGWTICGKMVPRAEVVYISQITIAFIVIIASLINLSINDENNNMWVALLSSSIGYIMPSPKIKKNVITRMPGVNPEAIEIYDDDVDGGRRMRPSSRSRSKSTP